PRSLTEPIVQYTLEPLVYVGPAEGKPKGEWKLKSAKELLELKICDMACGSGAFLVQAARYMAERLLEAWDEAKKANPQTPGITPEGTPSTGKSNEAIIPDDPAERKTYAMRIIAQRCLYGVDKNPLAAEMAKLSLWLLTLAKDKPFEFLDHSIRCGDSLVGLHSIDQLRHFNLKPDPDDAVLFKGPLDSAVDEAITLRLKLEDLPANSVDDVERQEKLLIEANEKIARLRCAADLLVAAEFWGESAKDKLERVRHASNQSVIHFDKGPTEEFEQIAAKERRGKAMFHWPLEFPEVIVKRGGFDAFVGNPPFMGGQKITGNLGNCFRAFLIDILAHSQKGSADLSAYFFLRAGELARVSGGIGFLATNSIAQGETRTVGLEQLSQRGFAVSHAISSETWPGEATVFYAAVWLHNGKWNGESLLDGKSVSRITSYLTPEGAVVGEPHRLTTNARLSFQGNILLGMGFVLTPEEAHRLIQANSRNGDVLFPYLVGEDLNASPTQQPSRWAIQFGERDKQDAQSYTEVWQLAEERIWPERSQKDAKKYPRMVNGVCPFRRTAVPVSLIGMGKCRFRTRCR
ncbi:MAG: restriction endonuclease, partial [Planctomycetota bacterium]|nr:restriction endonuclease [Planctomycetota bacterium]